MYVKRGLCNWLKQFDALINIVLFSGLISQMKIRRGEVESNETTHVIDSHKRRVTRITITKKTQLLGPKLQGL